MIKKLEERLKKFNNKEIAMSSFLAIGLPLLLTPIVGNLALVGGSFAIPFFITSFFNRKYIHKKQHHHILETLTSKFYKKEFKQSLFEYINASTSSTEKKYKILFIKMWMDIENLSFNSFINKNDESLNNIMTDIKNDNYNKSDKHNRCDLMTFLNDIHEKDNYYSYDDFLKEDEGYPERLNAARKAFEDFKHLGLLAQNMKFIGCSKFSMLCSIQDYQFNDADAIYIKGLIDTIENSRISSPYGDLFNHTDIFVGLSDIALLEKIISKENNTEYLTLLKKYFSIACINKLKDGELFNLLEKMHTKINYMNLDSVLETKHKKETKKTSRKI